MASRTVRSHRAAILAPDASQEMSKLKGTDTVLFFFFLKEYFRVGGMLSVITHNPSWQQFSNNGDLPVWHMTSVLKVFALM